MPRLDLSLTDDEREAYLAAQRTVRVATVGREGTPHVVPLWFVWVDGAMFLNSTRGNPTVENMLRSGWAAAVVDDGDDYDALRGVEVAGPVTEAEDHARLPDVEEAWSRKYLGGRPVPFAAWRNRVWLRLEPRRVASWDFRKIPEARTRRAAERAGGG